MAEPPHQVKELVERFEKNIEAYQSQAYNEAQVRQEFINPFFEALGWDVANKQGKNKWRVFSETIFPLPPRLPLVSRQLQDSKMS